MRAPNNKPTQKTEERLADTANDVTELPPVKEIDITTLLQELLGEEDVLSIASKRLDSAEDITNIKAILSEYFESFLIMGYGVEGKRILIKHSQNEKDEDSLVEMLRFVFMKMIQGGTS